MGKLTDTEKLLKDNKSIPLKIKKDKKQAEILWGKK